MVTTSFIFCIERMISMEMDKEDILDKKLKEILVKNNMDICPCCGRQLDRGDVAWNTACTEAGTDYSVVSIICQACDDEMLNAHTWYCIDNFEDLVEELESVIEEYIIKRRRRGLSV